MLWKSNHKKLVAMPAPSYESCLAFLVHLCNIYSWDTEKAGGTHPLLANGNRNYLKHYASLMSDWMNSKSINEIIASNLYSHKGQRIQNGYNADNTPCFEYYNEGSKVHILRL